MKWSGPKNRYEVPDDPGFITRLYWAIGDYLSLSDKATIGLMLFALALLIIVLAAVPGPH